MKIENFKWIINIAAKKIVKILFVLWIIWILLLWFIYFVTEAFKIRAWIRKFWNMSMSEISESMWDVRYATLSINIDDARYSWNVKSAQITGDLLQVAYYYPFDILTYKNGVSFTEYKLIDHIKDLNWEYDKYPFYLVYNKKTSEITYLNARKEILKWGQNAWLESLNKLDKSDLVDLWEMFNFKTFFKNSWSTDYSNFIKKLNQYSASQYAH